MEYLVGFVLVVWAVFLISRFAAIRVLTWVGSILDLTDEEDVDG